ncbi:putative uncharacterized protein [Clostridium sp. CAG:510]|nr:putative uncharacterized protein [Clostridium sp. CAG:510]
MLSKRKRKERIPGNNLFAGNFFLWVFFLFLIFAVDVKAEGFYYPPDTDGELVVVIDPGHGGSNLGADYNGFLEKEMNLTVAEAMAEELREYEGITVYLTHEDLDTDIRIKDRAAFAKSVNADFLFCLHFNMSPGNILYGSEVWISAYGEENRQGYTFAGLQLNEMRKLGLSIRGIKTRLNEEGTADYYGILRFCEAEDIPAALIEHCHIDNDADVGFCDSKEDLIALGKADATAAAKFFRLSSKSLGVDYSDNTEAVEPTPGAGYAKMDTTDPDICMIEENYTDLANKKIGIQVTGCDYDSPMQYYSYSIDGGETFTPYLLWPDADMLAGTYADTFNLEIDIPEGVNPDIVVKGINQYDRYTLSNHLNGYPVFTGSDPDEVLPEIPEETEEVSGNAGSLHDTIKDSADGGFKAPVKEENEEDRTFVRFVEISLLAVFVIFTAVLFVGVLTANKKRHKKKRKRRKK